MRRSPPATLATLAALFAAGCGGEGQSLSEVKETGRAAPDRLVGEDRGIEFRYDARLAGRFGSGELEIDATGARPQVREELAGRVVSANCGRLDVTRRWPARGAEPIEFELEGRVPRGLARRPRSCRLRIGERTVARAYMHARR